jgi:NADPH-dependent 2,4-dienoyl-CoA reductase/sulfur reductase-like enzyme
VAKESKADLVVVGGGAAGMSAASTARRRQRDWEIVALDRTHNVSFILCGLPYFIEGAVPSERDLIVYTPDYFRSERRIDVRTRHEVRRIDPGAKAVHAVDLASGDEITVAYEKLVFAGGALAVRPPIPGIDLEGVFLLRSIESGTDIKEFVRGRSVRRAAIIGGGYVGLEMAEALRGVGAEVTLFEALPHVYPGGEPEIAEAIEEKLRRQGVTLRTHELARAFEGDGAVRKVVADGGDVDVDLVLVAVGARPDVAVAKEAGIALGETGAIATDDRMRTNLPDVYAAGDCTEARQIVTGKPTYVPLGTTANKQGRVAGENAAGGDAIFAGIVGTAAVKVFDLEVARTGLTEAQAREEGFDAISTVVHFSSHAGYYPGARPLTLKLVADRPTGRILGAQMVGPDTVAKRIDTVAAALHASMTIDDLPRLDLTYAPPFATSWEGIQVAAQRLARQ